jgi:hypothetical protein
MRLFRFFVIFSLLSFMLAACGVSDDEETDTGSSSGSNPEDSTGDNPEDSTGEENQQNVNCGDKIVDAGEVCDGGAQECKAIDSGYTGGFASCRPDCTGWDTSACQGSASNNNENPNDPGNNTTPGGNGDGGFDKDSQGIWVDPKPFKEGVHLIWENPMGNKGTGGLGPTHAQSQTYCENLVLAGADDWRLPTIDELRTLVRGISTIEPGGKCPTSESCTKQETCNDDKENTQGFGNSCLGCEALNTDKYDPADSYLDLENDCQLSSTQLADNKCYIVKAMHGDPCDGTWSNTPNTGTAASMMKAFWYLNYKSGIIHSDADVLSGANWVRCVREGTAADVTEEEEEETDPSQNWECTADIDCTGGKTCQSHKCVAVTYVSNGLEWQRGTVNETLNKWEEGVERVEKWEPAKAYCENLDYAGHNDWRLPNLTELKSLVQGCAATNECPVTAENPAYPGNYSSVCKTCASGNYMPAGLGLKIDFPYWTSTTDDPSKATRVWAINFMNGEVFYSYASANHYAMCVRNAN